MNIDKNMILQLLQSQGQSDHAAAADGELPDQVDTDNPAHADLLSKFGLNSGDLMGQLGGLGGMAGGLGGLGKLI